MLYTAFLLLLFMMHRTQVYFEKEVLETLRQEAKEKKTTLAAVIRGKVMKDTQTKQSQNIKKQMNAAEAIGHLVKLGKKHKVKGPKDLSQRIDEFVYKT